MASMMPSGVRGAGDSTAAGLSPFDWLSLEKAIDRFVTTTTRWSFIQYTRDLLDDVGVGP
jgi:hypothetical protein